MYITTKNISVSFTDGKFGRYNKFAYKKITKKTSELCLKDCEPNRNKKTVHTPFVYQYSMSYYIYVAVFTYPSRSTVLFAILNRLSTGQITVYCL